MRVVGIDSETEEELGLYRTLRGNLFEKDGSFVADSARVVDMLLDSGLEFKSLLCDREYLDSRREKIESAGVPVVYIGDKKSLESIVGYRIHHGVMAHLLRPPNVPLEDMPDRIVLADGLSNMENIGAIARSAAALGVGGYIVPSRGPHPYGRRAIRVSTGHVTKLSVHVCDDTLQCVSELSRMGYEIVVAEAVEDAVGLGELRSIGDRWVLIVGNEEDGVSERMLERCDRIVKIEMQPGVKSFNAAIAASIVMWRLSTLGSV